jgi:transcriptional regulator with XRE-family HTH domain
MCLLYKLFEVLSSEKHNPIDEGKTFAWPPRWILAEGIEPMQKDEKACRELLSKNIKRFRNRLGLSQLDLALELEMSTTFLSDIETGKKWVSAKTLAQIARALKIEVFELFRPEEKPEQDISAAVLKYLDDVDDAIIKSIEQSIRPAVQKSLEKMRRFYRA